MEVPDSEPPDAARIMLYTKRLNEWAHAAYTFEEVAEMNPLIFEMLGAIQRGLAPAKKGE